MSRVRLGEIGAVCGLRSPGWASRKQTWPGWRRWARLTGTLLIDSDGGLRPGC